MELERELGRGGFAAVWLGRRDRQPVAIKISHRGTDAARQRIAREAAALERLAGAHAPRLLEHGVTGERPYIVMEYVAAAPATEIAPIARAVAAVHAAGVVHGDLKPDNLTLRADGSVALYDFGSATLDGAPAPVGGSIEYMAPELWRGAAVSRASDVYALGVVLVELATGQPPFTGEARSVGYQHAMLRPDLAALPPELAPIAARCLAKDPAQRPAADELAALGPLAAVAPRATAAHAPAPQPCALLVADVRAPAPELAQAITRAGGVVLYVRGQRIVAAWTSVANGAAAAPRAAALARELHDRHGAHAFLAIEHIPYDAETGKLVPGAAHVAPAWLPVHWHGVVATERFAALAATAGDDAPLLGRDGELAAALAAERVAIVGAPGSGTTHFARHLARARGVPYASARSLAGVAGAMVISDIADATDALLASIDRTPGWLAVVGMPRRTTGTWERVDLPPLPADAAAALVERELAIDRVPAALVARFVAAAGGRPRRICELVAHARASGAIKQREGVGRWYVAADELALPDHDLEAFLADGILAGLPAELRALAAACAGLEPGFAIGELEAVIDQVAGAAVDPALGLGQLAARGLAAVDDTGTWHLTSESLARVAARALPATFAPAALAHAERSWHGDLDGRQRRALARYAAAAGDSVRAARLLLALADDARRAHSDVAAEADYTAALAGLSDDERAAALLGRGIVRYRLDRARDALADLDAAAATASDPLLVARARLELATAYDWLGDYAASARACAGVPALPELACALAMARGRSALRAGDYRTARRELEAAIDSEGIVHADEQLIAKLLLGPVLVQLGELAEAERVFASALAGAEFLGDTLARSAAHGNRVLLWSARRDDVRARADLEAARALARSVGHAVPERNTTYNLAEYCYWHGELAEAARLAEASRDLQRRLVGDAFEDEVLIARIAAARGDLTAARAALARADATERAWPVAIRCLRDALAAFLDRAPDRAAAIEAAARRDLVGAELDEALRWTRAARTA